jgi:hypothetical protein
LSSGKFNHSRNVAMMLVRPCEFQVLFHRMLAGQPKGWLNGQFPLCLIIQAEMRKPQMENSRQKTPWGIPGREKHSVFRGFQASRNGRNILREVSPAECSDLLELKNYY